MMPIVIDTNAVASAVFFGDRPEELLRKVLNHEVSAHYQTNKRTKESNGFLHGIKER